MVDIEPREMWKTCLARRTARLALGLQALVDIETPVAALAPKAVEDTVNPDALRTYMLAIDREFGELLEEFNWKPWKLPTPAVKDRLLEEFADILAFLGIIIRYVMLEASCNALDLANRYRQKSLINIERLEGRVEGYGVGHEREKQE